MISRFGAEGADQNAIIDSLTGKDAELADYLREVQTSADGAGASVAGYTSYLAASRKAMVLARLEALAMNLALAAIATVIIWLGKVVWEAIPTLGHLEERLDKSSEKWQKVKSERSSAFADIIASTVHFRQR